MTTPSTPVSSRLINSVLSIKPLANLAKQQARTMMIKRAEKIGVPWTKQVESLQKLDWDSQLKTVQNLDISYPDYYLKTFHAYDNGNLSWDAALEVEVAAYAVHAKVWGDIVRDGDAKLRQSYHDILRQHSPHPQDVLDLGCSVGMSTFALQEVYPNAKITGLDLSPYFLAVAQYNSQNPINWVHGMAESTGLPSQSFDLVSSFLMFHELPQEASIKIIKEARRLLRPGGYLAIMDMNPKSEIYAKMPPYILTLLKSTEPYLDEYFGLDIEKAIADSGFTPPIVTQNSPRHRTIVAQTIG